MNRLWKIHIILVSLFFLTACMYPKDRLAQNRIPYKDQIVSVQNAVEQFQLDNGGILPIQTRDASTQIYLKYPVDFNRITPRYLPEPPGNAFESGGVFQYVLVNVEEEPTVKLIDLRVIEVIRDLKLRLNIYRDTRGYPPFKDEIAIGYYSLDYEKMNYNEPPFVMSPFTGNNLSLIINGQGEIFVDYSPDLYQTMQQVETQYSFGDDIRDILVEKYDFVPVYSVPTTILDGDPVLMKK
jgi:hypothetical protein